MSIQVICFWPLLYCVCVCTHTLGHVRLFATPSTVAPQASLSMGVPRQEYWSGLPFPSPGDLPGPRIEPVYPASPALAGRFFTTAPLVKPFYTMPFRKIYYSPTYMSFFIAVPTIPTPPVAFTLSFAQLLVLLSDLNAFRMFFTSYLLVFAGNGEEWLPLPWDLSIQASLKLALSFSELITLSPLSWWTWVLNRRSDCSAKNGLSQMGTCQMMLARALPWTSSTSFSWVFIENVMSFIA